MKPVQFEQATGTLGYTVAGRKVPVVRDHLRGETVSCWKMNALERLFALFTGRVWLRVISTSPEPAAMQVRSPFRAPSGAPGKRDPLSAKQMLRWVKKLGKAAVVAFALAAPAEALPTQVLYVATSPDGQWRVEISASTHPPKFELWAVPSVGGTKRRIGHTVPHDHDVFELVISADSRRVAYRQGRTATGESHLYVTPIDRPTGSAGIRLSQPGGRVDESGIRAVSGGTWVRYSWASVQGAASSPYAVAFTGGAPLAEIFADGFESGSQGAWK